MKHIALNSAAGEYLNPFFRCFLGGGVFIANIRVLDGQARRHSLLSFFEGVSRDKQTAWLQKSSLFTFAKGEGAAA